MVPREIKKICAFRTQYFQIMSLGSLGNMNILENYHCKFHKFIKMVITLIKSNISTSKKTFEHGGTTARSRLTSTLPNPKSGCIVSIASSPFFIVATARSKPAITCSTDSKMQMLATTTFELSSWDYQAKRCK